MSSIHAPRTTRPDTLTGLAGLLLLLMATSLSAQELVHSVLGAAAGDGLGRVGHARDLDGADPKRQL